MPRAGERGGHLGQHDRPGETEHLEASEAHLLAIEADLEIIPVINKIDLPAAQPDRVVEETEQVIGITAEFADGLPELPERSWVKLRGTVDYETIDGVACIPRLSSASHKFDLLVLAVSADKAADLAVANWNGDSVSVLMGNGDGSFTAAIDYGAGNAPGFVAAVDEVGTRSD